MSCVRARRTPAGAPAAQAAAESAAAEPPSEAEEAAAIERLQTALRRFEGTHAFHNFTKRANYDDASLG